MSSGCGGNCNGDEAKEKLQKLNNIIEENKDEQGSLIKVLHEAQLVYGYLPLEVQKTIADGLNIPLSEVYGVVTFYTQFSLKPKGKYHIAVCMGTACYVKGAGDILDEFNKQLGLAGGEDDCTEDGRFSIEACRCIGACGLAPVLTINEDVHGKIYSDDVAGVLAQYPKSEQ